MGWLRSISQVLCGTMDPSWGPSRAPPAGMQEAACLHHLHQLGRDRSLRCKAEQAAGLDAHRGLHMGVCISPSLADWGLGALGAATQRRTKPALGSGAYKPPDRHSSATGTHTHTHWTTISTPRRTQTRVTWGGQEEVGVKALAWHQAEPPRAGAPWAVAKGRSRHALPHHLLPLSQGGQQGPCRATSPPSNTSLQESCRLQRGLKSA